MAKIVDYYHSLESPWTYLGVPRFRDILERAGARTVCKPVDYGKIFPATGGLPLGKRAPERRAYRLVELRRWRDHLGLPLNLEPKNFPVDESLAARMVIAAREAGADAFALSTAILTAVWAEERDISEPATLGAIARENGLDSEALLAATDNDETRRRYADDTDEAIARGVFGAPTYVFEDELFWGQDRLDFLARALTPEEARVPGPGPR